jgi:hypothetical protein
VDTVDGKNLTGYSPTTCRILNGVDGLWLKL